MERRSGSVQFDSSMEFEKRSYKATGGEIKVQKGSSESID